MKTLYRGKQERDILLRQIGVFLVQGLSRIKRQGFTAPSLPGIEEWGRYLAGGFKNHAQMRTDAPVFATRIVLIVR
jgi:hypothetical protein